MLFSPFPCLRMCLHTALSSQFASASYALLTAFSCLLAFVQFARFLCLLIAMNRSYTLFSLASILSDRSTTLDWLRDVGIIPSERFCTVHRKTMTLQDSRSLCGMFRCYKRNLYDHCISVAHNTWLERCHTTPAVCILITYCFATNLTFEQTLRECAVDPRHGLSRETVSDRFAYCREVCMMALDEDFVEEGLIGGPGEVIEIDECKIGRRKYERGRVVEGCWILGMIHRGHPSAYRLEICLDNKRDQNTLVTLIKKHVAPGSVIHTDCWKGYQDLEKHGYLHYTVNHSVEFIDSSTGAHTQNIESSWRWMRRQLSRGGVHVDNFADHLCEFLWHRRVRLLGHDPFIQLLNDIKRCYPGR